MPGRALVAPLHQLLGLCEWWLAVGVCAKCLQELQPPKADDTMYSVKGTNLPPPIPQLLPMSDIVQ